MNGQLLINAQSPKTPGSILLPVAIGVAILLGIFVGPRALAQQTGDGKITDQQITELQQSLEALKSENPPLVTARRTLKKIVRQGQEILDASPDAPNRFAILAIMFDCQKRLIAVDNTQPNREVLFAISASLAQAPDQYAEARLEADLMLAEQQHAQANATLEQRAQALAQLIDRYRNTPAEAKSLLMGALIAQKLNAPQLEDDIQLALDENFSDDPAVIEFRRKHLQLGRLDVVFKGEFTRADGAKLKFPADTAGHLCLHIFWSKQSPAFDAYLDQLAQSLGKLSAPIKVFSFNLDDLPDAGQSILREKGLDWQAMKLPGGRTNQAYQTYARGDPMELLVNEYGFAVLRPDILPGKQFAVDSQRINELLTLDSARISEPRYSAQLQWLFIGEFLVSDAQASGQWPATDPLKAGQDDFVPPPHRYRLSPQQALLNYQQAATLYRNAIEQQPDRADQWRLRDRRLIALLGIWNLASDPGSLAQAVEEATSALASDLPAEAQVVPRFCLAKDQIRRADRDPEAIVIDFIKQSGGDDATARALAAACVLALDARSRELHESLRDKLLERHGSDPSLYAFCSFLRDRHHRYRLLHPNHSRRETSTRGYIVNHGGQPMREPFPSITLKKLDGSDLILPRPDSDKITILLFVEPPADGQSDFPVVLNRKGEPTTEDAIRTVAKYAQTMSDEHVNQGVEVITAFICDDAARVEALARSNKWTSLPVIVPDGLNNPMVRQLGILSADNVPNVFLLRRDGTVAWRASGLRYKSEFGFPYAFLLAMKVHIETIEVEEGYRALQNGQFERAARMFSGPFRPFNPDRFGWRSPQYHGQAMAQMGLGKFDAALEAIDLAIDAHKLRHYRGRGPSDATQWRQLVADFTVREPCDVLAMLWTTRAQILDKLGRADDAQVMRAQAKQAVVVESGSIYGAFHQKLSELNIKPEVTNPKQ